MDNPTTDNKLAGLKILIVDDIAENLKVLGAFLRNNNFVVLAATNGQQAIDTAYAKIPDLVLLDIQMPGVDGFQVCLELKKNDLTKDIPVIFLTARTSGEDLLRGFEVGGVDYITKPFNFMELKARVNTHLELGLLRKIIKQQKTELDKRE